MCVRTRARTNILTQRITGKQRQQHKTANKKRSCITAYKHIQCTAMFVTTDSVKPIAQLVKQVAFVRKARTKTLHDERITCNHG